MPRGFILQPTYRIENGRAVVLLYGRLESGSSFLVRDDRCAPHFFIPERAADAARQLGARVPSDLPLRKAMDGTTLSRVDLALPRDAAWLRERLTAAGIPCLEADVRFPYRYLIDHGIRACVHIHGQGRPTPGIDATFVNPRVEPADWCPRLRVLSLDIETDPGARRLLSIALAGPDVAEVLLLTPPGHSCPDGARPCRNEAEMLALLVRRVREIDPDILTGWNVIDFDLAVLLRCGARAGVALALGRGPEALRLRRGSGGRGATRASLPGRVVLDGIELVRGAFVKLESYALDAVARAVLGRGKTIHGGDRAEQILEAFASDREHLVEYNLNDARLVLEIQDRLQLIELTVERSRLTGLPPDRVTASIAAFDLLYLTELSRRGIAAPSVSPATANDEATSGGHVIEPKPGLYRNVAVLDFKSLYPSIIRTFQIDPLGHHARVPGEHPIVAPNGAEFRRRPGILPKILDDLFPRREAAKAAGDPVASQAIKILMNSFYGVLATSACRFASPLLANAITGFGREILVWSQKRIEQLGYDVLYGDTDSLFVLAAVETPEQARAIALDLVRRLNDDLRRHVQRRWRVPSRLELEFERLYLRLLLPALRHGTAGARKRYVGLVEDAGGRRVVFTGMEVVRRDWTPLAKQVQRKLYERLFDDRGVADYLCHIVGQLRAGRLDPLLVYRKRLRKPLEDYTASTPPHVAAARKMRRPPRRTVAYVITRDGPEPAAEQRAPVDHEHYVQKQIRPVAEPVLTQLGLDFRTIVDDPRQQRLF